MNCQPLLGTLYVFISLTLGSLGSWLTFMTSQPLQGTKDVFLSNFKYTRPHLQVDLANQLVDD